MEMQEVIRKEGDTIVLYTHDGDRVLGRFPFGAGKQYASEETAREAAEKRERQIQFFKSREADLAALKEKHSPAWHRCWEKVKENGYSPERAAAICTWSVSRPGGASVYEAFGDSKVVLTVDEAMELDELLAAEMEIDNVVALIIDTDTWEIERVFAHGETEQPFEIVPEILASERIAESDTRSLTETWDRSATQAGIDAHGNLYGIVVVEGMSANGNHYTHRALESGPAIFAGKPIYKNHPTRTEERDRPERDIDDKIGKLPESVHDFWIDKVKEGPFAGRYALFYKNGILSETASDIKTKIREGILGDQSINAEGRGRSEADSFVVEAFTNAISLDFVTRGAAGGRGFVEAERDNRGGNALDSLTFEQLCEARPDIVDTIGARERRKAYGEKAELNNLKQEVEMSTELIKAMEARLRQLRRENAQSRASKVVEAGLAGQPAAVQSYVRQLVEADVRRFVEQEEMAAAPAEPAGELAPVGGDLSPGSPPNLELPPDVGMLPEEAQALWLETYTAALPEGEEVAVHKAWAAVFDAGWLQNEAGEWTKMQAEPVAPEAGMAEIVTPPMTEAQLRGRISSLVAARRRELAAFTNAGQVRGLGSQPDQQAQNKITEAQQMQAFLDMGLTEEQAKIALRGR